MMTAAARSKPTSAGDKDDPDKQVETIFKAFAALAEAATSLRVILALTELLAALAKRAPSVPSSTLSPHPCLTRKAHSHRL